MKRRGSPVAAATYKRTRVSQATTSNEPGASAPRGARSSRPQAKQFDSVNVDRLRESSLSWEIWSDDLPGSEVFYLPGFLEETAANEMYAELQTLDTCKHQLRKQRPLLSAHYSRVPSHSESTWEEYHAESRRCCVRYFARSSRQIFWADGQYALSLSFIDSEAAKRS